MPLDSTHQAGNIMPPIGSNNPLATTPLDMNTHPPLCAYKPPSVDIEGRKDPFCDAKVKEDDQHGCHHQQDE